MSSAGLLEIVTPEWLVHRIGPTKRWSADSLSNLLDPPLLEKLRLMWAAGELPGSQLSTHTNSSSSSSSGAGRAQGQGVLDPAAGPSHDAVVKHRVLLSLLSLRPPIPDEVLLQARALVAVAALDASGTQAGRALVATTLAQLLRLNPSFLPDPDIVAGLALDRRAVAAALAAARDGYAARVRQHAQGVLPHVLASVRPPPTPAALAAAAAVREGLDGSRGLPTLPPHPGQAQLGDLPLHARLHEPPPLLWQHYAHAPPAGPLEAVGGGKPLPPAGTPAGSASSQGPGGLHYSLTKATHSAVAQRAGLLSKGVGALHSLALGGEQGEAASAELEGVLSSLAGLLRQGTEAGAGASARRLVGDASRVARSGLGLGLGLGLGGLTAAAGTAGAGSGSGVYRKRGREAAQIVSEEELQRLQEGGGKRAPAPTPTPTPTPAPAPAPKQAAAPGLEAVLADCPLLPEAARAVVQAFKEGRKYCGDAPARGSPGAGAPGPLPSGVQPLAQPAGEAGVQLQHVYPVREQAVAGGGPPLVVHLLLQFDARGASDSEGGSEPPAAAASSSTTTGSTSGALWRLWGRKKAAAASGASALAASGTAPPPPAPAAAQGQAPG